MKERGESISGMAEIGKNGRVLRKNERREVCGGR
jgi:hypothetical protein